MSAAVFDQAQATDADLADIYDQFVADDSLPSPEWLTQLNLKRPRRNLCSLDAPTQFFKRVIDVVGATVLLLMLWPVMLLVAVAVKLTSPGPIIYSQVRVGLNLRERQRDRRQRVSGPPNGTERRQPGRDRRQEPSYGRLFTLYKFRTMLPDRTAGGRALTPEERLTPLGRFLRASSLDELPQLWNVLKGDMSLIGPRPLMVEYLPRYSPEQARRHEVRPGITGLAQVNGRNRLEWARRFELDVWYIDHWSLWLDAQILAQTIVRVLARKDTGFEPDFMGNDPVQSSIERG